MDVVFILAVVALYAVTHWLVWAIERIRSPEDHDLHHRVACWSIALSAYLLYALIKPEKF